MMYDALVFRGDHPAPRRRAPRSTSCVVDEHEAYCQPCLSPVWDTGAGLPCAAGSGRERAASVGSGLDWLMPQQVLDVMGDWAARRPDVRPGGWAFQYANAHYPDLDDTAVVVMALDRGRTARAISRRIERGRNGSWACNRATAAGARSTPTTAIIISTIFRSPIMARCSIRPPRT